MLLERLPLQRTADPLADGGGIGQDLLHPVVRLELLAMHDADGGELAGKFHVIARGRLVLDVLVDHLEEAEIAGRDRVERFPATVDELHFGDLRLAGELDPALEGLGDGRPEAAGHIGIDLQVLLDVIDSRLGVVAILDEGPHGVENRVGLGMRDEIAVLGQ